MQVRLVGILSESAFLIRRHEIWKALGKEVVREGVGFPPIVTIVGGNQMDVNYLVREYRMPLEPLAKVA